MSKARQNASAYADISAGDAAIITSFPAAISGLRMARVTATKFSVAPGMAANSNGTPSTVLMKRTASLTKSLSAWAIGADNGSLDTGTVAVSTWYHVHLIRRDSDGATDVLLSISATAPTMPTGWSNARRIGSILTDGSSQITPFLHVGDRFLWDAPTVDFNTTNPGTVSVTATLTVPTGVVVFPICNWIVKNATTASIELLVSALDLGNFAASSLRNTIATAGTAATARSNAMVETVPSNMLAQVRYRMSASGAADTTQCITFGWIDQRGV